MIALRDLSNYELVNFAPIYHQLDAIVHLLC